MTQTSLSTFLLAGPEIVLVVAALVAYLGGAFCGLRQGWLVALIGIAVAACWPGMGLEAGSVVSSGPFTFDDFALFVRRFVLLAGAGLALVQAGDQFRGAVTPRQTPRASSTCEEAGTFLLLLAGVSLVASANDLVLLFAGLELVSIPTYILLALKRTDAQGQEASLKYFFLSLVASALFLYGLACLYGIGGSTSLAEIGSRLRSGDGRIVATAQTLLPVAVGMMIGGIAFRLAAVPMHFYAPDVYEGAGPGNAALLSTLPKVAGIVVLLRLLALGTGGKLGMIALDQGVVGPAGAAWLTFFWQLTAVLAALTMTVGNCMALLQTNLRRLLACSSIAHAGYLLVGVAAAAAADATIGGRGGADDRAPRRSIYLDVKRSRPSPFLRAFDAPDRVTGMGKRSVTTTAPQVLLLMNGPAVRGWAETFAARVLREPHRFTDDVTGDTAPIHTAYALALGRAPTSDELAEAVAFLDSQTATYAAEGREQPAATALADFCQVLLGLNETLHVE